MDNRILKMTIFHAIFVVEFIWALKVGFDGMRIAAMVLCLIVVVLAYFNIGKRKWKRHMLYWRESKALAQSCIEKPPMLKW